jgi:putative Ig domain-containing protein
LPQIDTAILPNATYNQSYSATLAVSGGVPAYTHGLANDSGPLPDGMTLQSNTGQLGGMPTGAAGMYPVKFKVVDAQNHSATRTINITVADAPLVVTSAIPLAPASLTLPYSYQLSATGGRGGYAWSLASGTLPLGLTLSTGGLISGTPTKATSYSFVVKVTSGIVSVTKALSMTVTAPVIVTTTTMTDATVGVAYSFSVVASGGTRSYIWEIAEGTLPAGLTMIGSKIAGTPTTRESRTLVFRVTDTAGRVALSNPFTLNVYQVSITSNPALPDAMRGRAYSTTLIADGGLAPYKWSISSGLLPTGFTLATTGVISGTTQLAGNFTFIAKATDASGRTDVKTMTLTVNVDPAIPYITNSTLPAGSLTQPYSVQMNAISGPGNYVWSLASGTLPSGLTLSAGGLISGTPTTAATYSFTVRVTSGTATDTRSFSLPVAAAVVVTTTSLPGATVGTSYSSSLAATGGTRSYVWSIASGTLPAGLTFSGGKVSGTPTTGGSQTLVFRATDTAGRVALSNPLTLTVYQVSITTEAALPAAIKGQAYSVQLVAAGGVAPYVWSRSSGSLPSGLALNTTTGVISGTPTVTGTFTYAVKATDAGRRIAIKAFTLVVSP